ncbi:hypothetical protein Pfo_024614 [Paulownia fortunei]|nr:hypothetical protein Pfo_024614 [Paulownia fortunei]
MVGAAAPQSQPQTPAEEEALKRNTDCVYFLASPLTCKKGSECEYRHSDISRVNPRDCWFWLHGNCLNPKCGFRHPPLDGLLGTQVPASTGPTQPLLQMVTTPTAHVVNATSKQGVHCKFFQNGFCLKGDWCPFLHAPNSMNNKASLVPGTASAIEPATFKKAFGGLEKSAQDNKVPLVNVAKPVKDSPDAQPAVKVEPAPQRNELAINRRISGSSCIKEFANYSNAPPGANGNPVSWSIRVYEPHLLDEPGVIEIKDAEEVSREPSPGFDVLVDDEGRDSDFYHSEDQYGMSREYEARNEYDIGHSTDCNMIAEVDNERYQDHLGYDSHGHRKCQFALEQHRASSKRMSGGSPYLERRPYARADSRGQLDELDLRHRLAQNKQPNGLRSVVSHEHARDKHVEDRSYQSLRRHEHVSQHENSLSSRLRGRIRLPRRSSSPIDRNMTTGTDLLSPVRAFLSSNQGRIQDRIKGRVEEAFSNGWKNDSGLHLRRDVIGDNNADFAGPKSLAELKNRKNAEPSGQHVTDRQLLGKRKYLMLDGHQQSGNDLSFEGPKPLEEILKRKRGETIGTVGHRNSSNKEDIIEDSNQKEGKDENNSGSISSIGKNKVVFLSASINLTEAEEGGTAACNAAIQPVASKLDAEDGTIVKFGVDQEPETYEQRDESDSEQVGGEGFDLYDGENGEAEGEYLDDDDDDFATKMGVMYSER